MNQKQKLGYMALGAGILAFGITIGQFITPDIEAQNNGVFDKITCREIQVVDEHGKLRIYLDILNGASIISLHNSQGADAIRLYAAEGTGNSVIVYDKGLRAISLDSTFMSFDSDEKSNHVRVFDEQGKLKWETP